MKTAFLKRVITPTLFFVEGGYIVQETTGKKVYIPVEGLLSENDGFIVKNVQTHLKKAKPTDIEISFGGDNFTLATKGANFDTFPMSTSKDTKTLEYCKKLRTEKGEDVTRIIPLLNRLYSVTGRKDKVRHHLRTPSFSKPEYIIATDGHRAHALPAPKSIHDLLKTLVIPVDFFECIKKEEKAIKSLEYVSLVSGLSLRLCFKNGVIVIFELAHERANRYPDVLRLLKFEAKDFKSVTFAAKNMLNVVEKVTFSKDCVVLTVSPDNLKISSEVEANEYQNWLISATSDDETSSIFALNAQYVHDMLKTAGASLITFFYTEPTQKIHVSFSNAPTDLYIIMPIKL